MIIHFRRAAFGRGGRPRQLAEAFFGLALAPIVMTMDSIEALRRRPHSRWRWRETDVGRVLVGVRRRCLRLRWVFH